MERSSVKTSAVRLAALVMLGAVVGCDERTELVIVESQKEANRILVELERRGVPDASMLSEVRDRKTIWIVTVDPAHTSRARQILVQLDLPREARGGLEAMTSSSGLIPTKSDERAKLMHAIAQELEETFETVDGVIAARVHVAIPKEDMSLAADPETAPKPSATVLIKHLETKDARPPLSEESVKSLAAKSVEGLEDENVFVTFTATAVDAAVTGENGDDGTTPATPAGGDGNLMFQLYAAVVALGLLCVFLIVRLVKRPKVTRSAAA